MTCKNTQRRCVGWIFVRRSIFRMCEVFFNLWNHIGIYLTPRVNIFFMSASSSRCNRSHDAWTLGLKNSLSADDNEAFRSLLTSNNHFPNVTLLVLWQERIRGETGHPMPGQHSGLAHRIVELYGDRTPSASTLGKRDRSPDAWLGFI